MQLATGKIKKTGQVMKQQDRESAGELSLYDCYKIIRKRRKLVATVFLASVFIAALISFLSPKIYRAEVFVRLSPRQIGIEFVDIINKLDKKELKKILSDVYEPATDIELRYFLSMDKVKILIYIEKPANVDKAISSFVRHVNSYPPIVRYVEEERERLLKQVEGISKTIELSHEVKNGYGIMLRKRPDMSSMDILIELDRKISEMEIEKLTLEQKLKNLTGVEIVTTPTISEKPVKPKTKLNISLAGLAGLLVGIFWAVMREL